MASLNFEPFSFKEARGFLENTVFLMAGKIVFSVGSFFVFLLLARVLTVSDLIFYAFLTAITSLLMVVGNWGTSELLFQQGARSRNLLEELTGIALSAKLVHGLILGSLAVLVLYLFKSQSSHALVGLLVFVTFLIDSFQITILVAFRAQQYTAFEGWLLPVSAILRLLLVYLMTALSPELSFAVLGITLANLISFSITLYAYFQQRGLSLPLPSSYHQLRTTLRASSSFALLSFIAVGHEQATTILLGFLSTEQETAMFAVPSKIFQGMIILPSALYLVIQPPLVQLYKSNSTRWNLRCKQLFPSCLALSLVLASSLFFFTPYILQAGFGTKYVDSIPILQIFAIVFFLNFLWKTAFMPLFISSNRVNALTKISFAALGVSILTNFFFIPRFGGIGAAYALLCAESTSLILGISFLVLRTQLTHKKIH